MENVHPEFLFLRVFQWLFKINFRSLRSSSSCIRWPAVVVFFLRMVGRWTTSRRRGASPLATFCMSWSNRWLYHNHPPAKQLPIQLGPEKSTNSCFDFFQKSQNHAPSGIKPIHQRQSSSSQFSHKRLKANNSVHIQIKSHRVDLLTSSMGVAPTISTCELSKTQVSKEFFSFFLAISARNFS